MTPVTLHFRGLMACVAYFGSVRSFVRFGHGTFTGPDPVLYLYSSKKVHVRAWACPFPPN